jgi:antirestriction protein
MTYSTEPRIYAADLAAYNSGRLRGAWIDCAGKDADAIGDAIDAMLACSPDSNVVRRDVSAAFPSAEEYAVHDHEGFEGLISSEWPDLAEVAAIAEVLEEGDEDKRRGLLWLVNDRGYKIADAIERADEVRTFEGDAEDYAAELIEEGYSRELEALPDCVRYAIDWARVARDLVIAGDVDEYEAGRERFLVTNAGEF